MITICTMSDGMQSITRTCVYINVAYSVYFRFPDSPIVGLGLGLVVGLGHGLRYLDGLRLQ